MTGGLTGLGIPLGDVTALRTSIIEALNLNLEQNDKSNKKLRSLLEEKERKDNSAPATRKNSIVGIIGSGAGPASTVDGHGPIFDDFSAYHSRPNKF